MAMDWESDPKDGAFQKGGPAAWKARLPVKGGVAGGQDTGPAAPKFKAFYLASNSLVAQSSG
jgi:hypothetical protein